MANNSAGTALNHPETSLVRKAYNAIFGTGWSKEVMFADLSFYDGVVDFELLRYRTPMVILRAGQGNWGDTRYQEYSDGAKLVGLRRAVYWYYDDRYSPKEQAEKAIEIIQASPRPELPFFADWENTYGGEYGSIKHVVEFMQLVEEALSKQVGMYTGYFWFKENADIENHPEEELYLSHSPLWLAWYTNNSKDVRIPAPWMEATFWQWGVPAWGEFMGTSGSVDMNYYVGTWSEFSSRFGPDATEWEEDVRLDGFSHSTGYVNGAMCSFFSCDPKKVELKVRNGFSTVFDAVERSNAFAGVNGDGWGLRSDGGEGWKPNSIAVSDGRYAQADQFDTRPWIDFSENGVATIRWRGIANLYNAVSGDRYLVSGGEINPAILSRGQWKNARTAVGITQSGKVIIFVCHGWDQHAPTNRKVPPQGLGWVELAEVMLGLGCETAINLDGGGSVTQVILDDAGDVVQVGVSTDDGVQGFRSVVNQLLVFVDNESVPEPPIGEGMLVSNKETVRKRSKPNFYADGVGDLPPGVYTADEKSEDTKPVEGAPHVVFWFKVNGGWVPSRHHTEDTIYLEEIVTVPPPDPETEAFIEPIELTIEGTRYRTQGDKIPLDEVV